MKNLTIASAFVAATFAGIQASSATYILNQDFEDAAIFPVGSQISNSVVGDASTPTGGWIANHTSSSPTVIVDPTDPDNHAMHIRRSEVAGGYTQLIAFSVAKVTGGQFAFEFSFYLPTESTAVGASAMAVNFHKNANPNLNTSALYIRSGGNMAYWDANPSWAYQANTVTAANQWHHIRAEFDLGDQESDQATMSLFLNHNATPFVDGIAVNRNTFIGADTFSFLPQSPAGNSFYIDNVKLEIVPVPEPTAIGFALAGAAALVGRRRR